jgi:uroporphyrinogen-III decarboxylase
MNSLQRVPTVLAGGIPDRVPVCLHNFMVASRQAGVRLEEYGVNPEAIARVHLQAVEKYRQDCILVDTDTTLLSERGLCHPAHDPIRQYPRVNGCSKGLRWLLERF